MKTRFILLMGMLLLETGLNAQDIKSAESYFLDPAGRAQVMLLGTWHFEYYNLDAHTTDGSLQMDILSDQKQKELDELLDYLETYAPTHIVVEAGWNTGYLMHRLRRWKEGSEELRRNETDQIGLRMVDRMGLDTIYGADYYSLLHELDELGIEAEGSYLDSIAKGHYWIGENEKARRISAYYAYMDTIETTHHLVDVLAHMNTEEAIRNSYGVYLTGHFEEEGFAGPDVLSVFWYNRNLRIFRRIQQIPAGPGDRILVIFGAGHAGILDHLFDCSPDFELVPFRPKG